MSWKRLFHSFVARTYRFSYFETTDRISQEMSRTLSESTAKIPPQALFLFSINQTPEPQVKTQAVEDTKSFVSLAQKVNCCVKKVCTCTFLVRNSQAGECNDAEAQRNKVILNLYIPSKVKNQTEKTHRKTVLKSNCTCNH